MTKEECKNRYYLELEECEKCPYHFKCEIEQSAWNDVLYGDE